MREVKFLLERAGGQKARQEKQPKRLSLDRYSRSISPGPSPHLSIARASAASSPASCHAAAAACFGEASARSRPASGA